MTHAVSAAMVQALSLTLPSGQVVRLRFEFQTDRFGHVLECIDEAGNPQPMLSSVEGSPTDDWPASPALQSLSIEALTPGQPVALLVGMAGKSHWSASVEVRPETQSFLLDIACRLSTTPTWLGSGYQACSSNIPCTLLPTADLPTEIRQTASGWQVSPVYLAITKQTTVRWKYQIQVG